MIFSASSTVSGSIASVTPLVVEAHFVGSCIKLSWVVMSLGLMLTASLIVFGLTAYLLQSKLAGFMVSTFVFNAWTNHLQRRMLSLALGV